MSKKDIIAEITKAHLATNGGTAERELYRLIITGIPIKKIPNYDKFDYFDIHTPDDTPSFNYCYCFYNKLSKSAKQYILNTVNVDPFWHFIVSNIEKIHSFSGGKIFDLMQLISYLHEYYLYNKVYILTEEIQKHALSVDEILKLEQTSGFCCYNFTYDAKNFLVNRAKKKLHMFCEKNGLTCLFR